MQSTPADSAAKPREFFQSLNEAKPPKGALTALTASVGLHACLLLLLILVPLLSPQSLRLNYRTVMLAPPPQPEHRIEPVRLKLPPVRQPLKEPLRERPPVTPPIPAPMPPPVVVREPVVGISKAIPPPVPASPPVAPSSLPPAAIGEPRPAPPLPPPPAIVTNVFSSTAPASVPAAARVAATAGFGDANVKSDARQGRGGLTSAAGFDDAGGTREGRGRTGRRDGPVSTGGIGGFDAGNGTGATGRGIQGTVAAAGFAAASDPSRPAARPVAKAPEVNNDKPVEILSKPRPDYTDEARKQRIEGEVVLRVLFTSSGQARVLEVLNGLGHGLNENAAKAAQQIRFKPAERQGQPVDSSAIVHIVFELAY